MSYIRWVGLLIIGLIVSVSEVAYAADDQTNKGETTVVGICMIEKLRAKTPPINASKIEGCSSVKADAAPRCLGISEEEYVAIAKFCIAELHTAQCVAVKMNLSLLQYAECGYAKDPIRCFEKFGYSFATVMKLNAECQKNEEPVKAQ